MKPCLILFYHGTHLMNLEKSIAFYVLTSTEKGRVIPAGNDRTLYLRACWVLAEINRACPVRGMYPHLDSLRTAIESNLQTLRTQWNGRET